MTTSGFFLVLEGPEGAGKSTLGAALARRMRDVGIDPVLVTCDVDNVASRRTIEGAGGVYEDTQEGKLRFWIDLG